MGTVQFGDERRGVVRPEAESSGELVARRTPSLGEEVPQDLARLSTLPPVLADLREEVGAKLRVPDPGAQVVRGVEAGIHVREMTVRVIPHAGRLGESPRVALAG